MTTVNVFHERVSSPPLSPLPPSHTHTHTHVHKINENSAWSLVCNVDSAVYELVKLITLHIVPCTCQMTTF